MKKILLPFIAFLFSMNTPVLAQWVGADAFLQGDYVEVGVATNGSFGTGGNAPLGYHPRPDFGLTTGPMGFVADPAKDGWGVSSPGFPDYFGDYFFPGSPQEGWDIQVNGTRGSAWRGTGATSMTGGITGAITGYTSTATEQIATWEGTFGTLDIKQVTTQKKDKVYFVTRIELTNSGTTTLNGIYYARSLDPEPDATIGRNYSSNKKIIYQPNLVSKNCLVVATGQDYANAYVGLGSKDCRALSFIANTFTPTAALNNIFSKNGAASGYIYAVNGASTANTSMGVVFNVGNLAPGETTELAYAYILKQADLDSALNETAPSFLSATVSYKPYTTFRVCPGSSFPMKIKGGSAYKWTWSPGIGLTGDSIISSTDLPPSGGIYGDSAYITVSGPRTYNVRGVSLCDTLDLVFYVDTINFSTPPFVTSSLSYCQGATTAVPLTAGGASGATIWWSTAVGGVETTTAPTPSTATFGTTTYYVRQQNTAGCYSQYAIINVEIIPKPEPPTVKDTIYCFGTTAVPVTAVGENLKWYNAVTAGTQYPTAPTPSTTVGTTSFYPSQSVGGCVSDRSTMKVDISKITAGFDMSKDSLCGDEILNLTNTTVNVLDVVSSPFNSLWNLGDGNTSVSTDYTYSYLNLGSYAIKLKVDNIYGCKDSITKIVYVAPKSEVEFTQSDTIICQGESIDFAATATPNFIGTTWDFADGDVKSYNKMNVRKAFTAAGVFMVSFKADYKVCTEVEAIHQVEVTPVPNINIGRDTTICIDNAPLVLQNFSANIAPLRYLWSTGDTTDQLIIRHPGSYWLIAKDRTCASADSITISKGCYIDIPNAFMPGDANPLNAYFIPRDLLSKSAVSFEMKIFNRWGQLLFESNDVHGRGWDGNYKGQGQPMGVYVYQIRVSFANGINENYSGNITLLR